MASSNMFSELNAGSPVEKCILDLRATVLEASLLLTCSHTELQARATIQNGYTEGY